MRKELAVWPAGKGPRDRGEESGPLRDAATVVLVRDATDGPEAFLLHRHPSMVFAAGRMVFPGGGVDPRDLEPDLPWTGPEPGQWARWFNCPPSTAAALVCAAVRETFEECGVLLADGLPDAGRLEPDRVALAEGRASLRDVLVDNGLKLRADLLRPWAHWITPVFETRRYDTRFLLARIPGEQQARHVENGESGQSQWFSARQVLATRDRMLLPPTRVTLTELAAADRVEQLLAARRVIEPVMPRLEEQPDATRLVAELPEQPPLPEAEDPR